MCVGVWVGGLVGVGVGGWVVGRVSVCVCILLVFCHYAHLGPEIQLHTDLP